jgi:hypothetical protein
MLTLKALHQEMRKVQDRIQTLETVRKGKTQELARTEYEIRQLQGGNGPGRPPKMPTTVTVDAPGFSKITIRRVRSTRRYPQKSGLTDWIYQYVKRRPVTPNTLAANAIKAGFALKKNAIPVICMMAGRDARLKLVSRNEITMVTRA